MKTKTVKIGSKVIGGGNPILIQSMTNTKTEDIAATVAQINKLAAAGCDIIRCAVPTMEAAEALTEIKKQVEIPVVADIHFSAEIAIEAARRGAAKLRINPGNIGGLEKTKLVIEAAKAAGIPIRIGVNAGSLDSSIAQRKDLSLAEKLTLSAKGYVDFCFEQGFYDVIVSAKAHDVPTTVATYRLLSEEIPEVPLHIGVTEAGTLFQGLIKSASGLGILLEEGIGDTMRISLTDDPIEEIRACWTLLAALGLRRRNPELISCPTCGRCKVDLIGLAKQVERRLSEVNRPLQVAVMGCVVNGPGEAASADIGVACGDGSGVIFSQGKTLRRVEEAAIVDVLMEEIGKL